LRQLKVFGTVTHHLSFTRAIVSVHALELERLAMLDVESFPIAHQWYIVHREGRCLSPMVQAFREFIVNESRDIWRLPDIAWAPLSGGKYLQ